MPIRLFVRLAANPPFALFSKKAHFIFLLLWLMGNSISAQSDWYAHPKYREMAGLFLNHKHHEAAKVAEENLLSDSPHPLSAMVWLKIHEYLGDIPAALKSAPAALQPKLTKMAELNEIHPVDLYARYPLDQLNSFDELYLAYLSGTEHVNAEYTYAVVKKMLMQQPESFTAYRCFYTLVESNLKIDSMLTAEMKSGEFSQYKDFRRFWTDFLQYRPIENMNILPAVDHFLSLHPEEPSAWRLKGSILQNADLSRYEDALAASRKAFEIDPILRNGRFAMGTAAQCLARLQRFDECQHLLDSIASWYLPEQGASGKIAYHASILRLANEKGKARDLLSSTISQYPHDRRMSSEFGNLEFADGRYGEAAGHFLKAIEADGSNKDDYYTLIEAFHNNKEPGKAMEWIEKSLQKWPVQSMIFYINAKEVYMAAKELQKAEWIIREGQKHYHSTSWLWINLATLLKEQKLYREAIQCLNTAAIYKVPNGYAIDLYSDCLRALPEEGNKAVQSKLLEFSRKYPGSEAVWRRMEESRPDAAGKIAVLEMAIEANPGRMNYYYRLLEMYREQEQWELVSATLDKAGREIEKSGTYFDKLFLLDNRGRLLLEKMNKTGISEDEFRQGLEDMDTYIRMGGSPGYGYKTQSELHQGMGDKQTAAELLLKAMEYYADWYPWDLIAVLGRPGIGFKKMLEHSDRNPYDENRLHSLIKLHVMWGGSPIAAIIYGNRYKERFGESLVEYEAMAYGKLGDHTKDYELSYKIYTSIANGFRYVDWYNSTRFNAWKGRADITINEKTGEASIVLPDGVVIKRKDDIVLGKVEQFLIGPVMLNSTYDSRGNLTMLESSAGRKIVLKYDELEQITQMEDWENEKQIAALGFQYNEKRKVTRMEMSGKGAMVISYDETGEISAIDSEGDESIRMDIISTMNNLQAIIGDFTNLSNLSNLRLPRLFTKDVQYEVLSEAFDRLDQQIQNSEPENATVKDWMVKGVELSQYMYDEIHSNSYFGESILKTCSSIIRRTSGNPRGKDKASVVAAGRLYHDALDKMRYKGVSDTAWGEWVEVCDLLESEKQREKSLTPYRQDIENLQKYFNDHPIQMLSDAVWLPKSVLKNEGYWKKYPISGIVPPAISKDIVLNGSFYRKNGDILLGANHGILLNRKGYWEWMTLRDGKIFRDNGLVPFRPSAKSNILSMAESDDGMMYFGTSDGLVCVNENYEEVTNSFTSLQGLPSGGVTSIAAKWSWAIAGTPAGLVFLRGGQLNKIPVPGPMKCRFLKMRESDGGDSAMVLAGFEDGLYLATLGASTSTPIFRKIHSDAPFFAEWGPDNEVYYLRNKDLYKLVPGENDSGFVSIRLMGTIVTSPAGKVFGLAQVPVNDNDYAISVMTDYGLSLYHNRHFEHFSPPLAESNAWAKNISFSPENNGMCLITEKDVMVFRCSDYAGSSGRIFEVMSSDSLGLTFFTDQEGLKYIRHDDPKKEVNVFNVGYRTPDTKRMAIDKSGKLIINDGNSILSVSVQAGTGELINSEELFYCDQTETEKYSAGEVNKILIASDGEIWVAAGPSVFRYVPGVSDAAAEYNYFRAPSIFPSRTYRMDNVIETVDGRILAVGSNEVHLYHRGTALEGGLVEWVPGEGKFKRIPSAYEECGFRYFISGYTEVEPGVAIVGTTGGFAEDRNGKIRDFNTDKGWILNPSYRALRETNPSLFLGTNGTKFGDWWLFGCASGVVVYHDGNWMYPERFNRMLPDDQELGAYGSRHVNAIAADHTGHIYVGTDRGLLIYDSRGADPASFLFHNGESTQAVQFHNLKLLKSERDAVLSSIDEDSELGKVLAEIESAENQARDTETALYKNQDKNSMVIAGSQKPVPLDSLVRVLEDKRRRHADLLLSLQQKEPDLHQMLTLQPIDLMASRDKMKTTDVVIQYIPGRKSLFVQVIAKNKVYHTEVNIPVQQLMDTCTRLHRRLAEDAGLTGDDNERKISNTLCYLYDVLLRPVKNEISEYKNVYIVPVKALYYVPFAALGQRTAEGSIRYAIEDYNLGYVSSLYLFDLMYNPQAGAGRKALLIGNPDGTLPSASVELDSIKKGLGDMEVTMFKGSSATKANFRAAASGASIIHLATHGHFDSEKIGKSSVLFADEKMLMSEIYTLPLGGTELVTLSVCEANLGCEGMEYVTIARAFSSAGVPSVLATLWAVEDKSTMSLMAKFYRYFRTEKNKFVALSMAQRAMIKSSDPEFKRVARWAPFVVMGRY